MNIVSRLSQDARRAGERAASDSQAPYELPVWDGKHYHSRYSDDSGFAVHSSDEADRAERMQTFAGGSVYVLSLPSERRALLRTLRARGHHRAAAATEATWA
jgi:hypothetical protein